MINEFKTARRVSVPIVVIRTADQVGIVDEIYKASTDKKYPVVQWDAARGITPVVNQNDDAGVLALNKCNITSDDTIQFVEALTAVRQLPGTSVVCCHNAHRQLTATDQSAVAHNVQAVCNLRDEFKRDFRMIVLLCPEFVAPPELAHDVITIDDVLPNPEALTQIVQDVHASAELDKPNNESLGRAVDAVAGLSKFEAEQVVALSLREDGLNHDELWERKRATIEETRGLSVWRGEERFDDLVGLEPLKEKLRARGNAKTPVGVVVFIDEIDKVMANVEHDTTGVRMDQVRMLLTTMEDQEWRGSCLMGAPGGGKSLIAKAFGNEISVPTVSLDIGDLEAPHVGESEALVRHCMSVIKAIGRGNAYIIATSNNCSIMRPEMQRRFTDGFWFFDLMSDEQVAACWSLYMAKYDIPEQPLPSGEGWTGAEIRNCCREAWDTDCSLIEAAKFIVPIATARAEEIQELRAYANNRLLDANAHGVYRLDKKKTGNLQRGISVPQHVVQEVGNA